MATDSTEEGKSAVFLDRDGTLIEDAHYLSDPEQIRLLPGVIRALRRLGMAGYSLVVISNQSGIARGLFTREQLDAVNRRFSELLENESISLNGIYCCPHHPREGGKDRVDCNCRKPRSGLFEQAAKELSIDLGRSIAIGDRVRDILPLTLFAGRTGLVETGKPIDLKNLPPGCLAFKTLERAVDWILTTV